MTGYIKLHRKILENCIADKPEYLSLWVTLLLLANHQETSFIWNNKKQTLKAGELLTGRKRLSLQTGINESQIYKILNYLEKEHQIEQQKNSRFTVISIVNWDIYQQKEQQNNSQVTTEQQPSNTYKNVKNDKNVKKYNIYLEEFNGITKSNFKVLDNKTIRQLDILIANNFTIEDWKQAVKNASLDNFLMGSNDRKTKYLTPEYISRLDKFQQWLQKAGTKPVQIKTAKQIAEEKHYTEPIIRSGKMLPFKELMKQRKQTIDKLDNKDL